MKSISLDNQIIIVEIKLMLLFKIFQKYLHDLKSCFIFDHSVKLYG